MNRPRRPRRSGKSAVEVDVSTFAPNGSGWAPEARMRIARSLPGERVVAHPRGRGVGQLVKVLQPSAHRVAPSCGHAAQCHGCTWIHFERDAQQAAHVDGFRKELQRAGIAWNGDLPFHGAPKSKSYRHRARLGLFATGKGAGIVGQRSSGSQKVSDTPECEILEPALLEASASLRQALKHAKGRGEAVLATHPDGKAVVGIRWQGTLESAFWASLEQGLGSGAWAGVEIRLDDTNTTQRVGDITCEAPGPDGQGVRYPLWGFAQANAAICGAIGAQLDGWLKGKAAETAVELYAGAGTWSVLLGRQVGQLTTYEFSEDAVVAARANLQARGLSNVQCKQRDLTTKIKIPKCEFLLLDPPRAGAATQLDAVLASRPRSIGYISCHPRSFCADTATLLSRGRYALKEVHLFEMFPQTHHLEVAALFERR